MYFINSTNINKNEEKIWLALSPDYSNVGDIAISTAQKEILKKIYPNKKIIEVPMIEYYKYKNQFIDLTNNNDLITIIGGRKYWKYLYW